MLAVPFLKTAIISYQKLIRNYNSSQQYLNGIKIISYQKLIRNYNRKVVATITGCIISYQKLIRNYNTGTPIFSENELYHIRN